MDTSPPPAAVLLDLDGTLVDSVYLHVVTWHDALRAAGHVVPMARIHAGIGMGSDRLLPWLLGDHVDDADDISDDHKARFLSRAEDLTATPGARALLEDLEVRSVPFVVATSAGGEEREAMLAALGREDLPITGADEVESSKPSPDLLLAAAATLDPTPEHVTMVGDAPWDARAAVRIGADAVAVRCGGFSDQLLREAGATRVVDDPAGLIGTL
jgi:HAD superfamily hydrolase (TIGR01549 family)